MVCKEITEIVPPYQQKQINDTLGEFFSLSASNSYIAQKKLRSGALK